MRLPCARVVRRQWVCLLLLLGGCAKTGDPQPPTVLVPRPATDLAARQVADTVLLTVSIPAENTDGSPATTLAQVEIFRLVEEGSGSLSPRGEEDFLRQAQTFRLISADDIPAHLQGNSLVLRDELQPDGGDRAHFHGGYLPRH